MENNNPLLQFLNRTQSDPRIRTAHISVYLTLYREWLNKDCPETFDIRGKDLMEHAKISSSATWHKVIRALDEYGYIVYLPTFNKMKSSQVRIN